MKKAIFRFLGFLCGIVLASQCTAKRVDSLVPVFIGLVALIGAMMFFALSDGTEEEGADE